LFTPYSTNNASLLKKSLPFNSGKATTASAGVKKRQKSTYHRQLKRTTATNNRDKDAIFAQPVKYP
jgi:hypothetical protein